MAFSENFDLKRKTEVIATLENLVKDTEEKIRELKKECEEKMREANRSSYSDDTYHIVWREGSSSSTINVKKLQETDSILYEKLLQDYGKLSQRKGSFAWTREGKI